MYIKGADMIRTLGSTSTKVLSSCSGAKGKMCHSSMSSSLSDAPKDKHRSDGTCFHRHFLVSC